MKKFLFIILILLPFSLFAQPNRNDMAMIHLKGVNAVGFKVGSQFGLPEFSNADHMTTTLALTHTYYFTNKILLTTELEYEFGAFKNRRGINSNGQNISSNSLGTEYKGFLVTPTFEYAVWKPTKWLYLHLGVGLNLGADFYSHKDLGEKFNTFVLGATAGGNLEFYTCRWISILLKGQYHCLIPLPKTDFCKVYGKPNFSLAVRANIY